MQTENKKRIIYNKWIGEFNSHLYFWGFAVLGILILFNSLIKKIITRTLVTPILSTCSQNSIIVDVTFLILLLISSVHFIRKIKKDLLPTINSIAICIFSICIYLIFFRYDKTWSFYAFYNIAYSDVFIFSIVLLVIQFKSYQLQLTKKSNQFSLLEDIAESNSDDVYNRIGYSKQIAEHINSTSTKNSFAIGIIGEWGSGKTDFMLRLKSQLELEKDNILFEFNPWRVNKRDAIVEEFFKSLSKELKPYNHSIISKIKDYSKRILLTDKDIHYRFIDTLLNEWFPNKSLQEEYDEINESIKATGKRFIIFIDDLDRLTGKEIMEVLRIIRNTASFANTFFVVGIDQRYIVNVLRKTEEFSYEDEYLKKVFQLTITLPAFKKEIFYNKLCEYLIFKDHEERYQHKINEVLTRFTYDSKDISSIYFPDAPILSHIEQLLDNIRDLKRFSNSFKISFNILKDEVDIYDLMILELIRNKNIYVYNKLRDKTLLGYSTGKAKYVLNDTEWELVKNSIDNSTDISAIEKAIKFLVTDFSYKSPRKFVETHNFYLYFSYQLFNIISLKEFNETVSEKEDIILNKFKYWNNEGKASELKRIVDAIDDFVDADFLYKMVCVYLKMEDTSGYPNIWFITGLNLVFTKRIKNHVQYFHSDYSIHSAFLKRLMSNNELDLYKRASIAKQFLEGHIKKHDEEESYILSRLEWQKIVYCLFNDYLKQDSNEIYDILDFYRLNEYGRKESEIILHRCAIRRLRKYILTTVTTLLDFTKAIFIESRNSDQGYYMFQYWMIRDIFFDWNKYYNKLELTDFEEIKANQYRDFILKYLKIYYSSNMKPFKITGEDDLKFFNSLIDEGFVRLGR